MIIIVLDKCIVDAVYRTYIYTYDSVSVGVSIVTKYAILFKRMNVYIQPDVLVRAIV